MLITKRHLPRRAVLRGIGATMGLPLLDAMIPAAAGARAGKPPVRLGFFYVSNGCTMAHFTPKGEGRDFELSPIVTPFAPFRDQMTVVSGLANAQAEDSGGGPHSRAQAVWLSGVRPKRTEGADILAGTTLDQLAAPHISGDTPLRSLELALEPSYLVGNCDNGYACVYQNTFSWRTPTQPLVMENNPRAVFERLFGDGSSAAVRRVQIRRQRSILDSVAGEFGRLQQQLGPSDRTTMEEYLSVIRDVEQRIQKTEARLDQSVDTAEKPLSIPQDFDVYAKLMFDLLYLAYRSDTTRVATFQIAREQSLRTYAHIGVPNGHHDVSHHQDLPDRMSLNTKINTYHASLCAGLLAKLKDTPDGDGTLLDHSLMLYGAGLGNGDQHSPRNLPLVVLGGANGQHAGGQHLRAVLDTPMMNLGLSLLDKAGVPLEKVGDSTGRLAGI